MGFENILLTQRSINNSVHTFMQNVKNIKGKILLHHITIRETMFAASPLEVGVEQSFGDVSCLQLASTKESTIEALDSFDGGISVNEFNVHLALKRLSGHVTLLGR